MTLRKPNEGESVKSYDELQTTEINKVADYIVDYGSNENGYWEKWNSGKLVQWGRITSQVTMNVADGALFRTSDNITTNLPIAHVGGYETLFGLRNYTIAGIYTNSQGNNSFTFYPRSTVPYSNVNIGASWKTIGRWKT